MQRLFVYGSCVGGDTANVFPEDWDRPTYIARQSIISAAFGPTNVDGDVELTSTFQKSMLEGDISSSAFLRLPNELDSHDALLLDIVDERLGVYEVSPGEYLTRSMELIGSKLIEKQASAPRLIEFATEEHWALWTQSVDKLFRIILESKTPAFALVPPWAESSVQGEKISWHQVPVETMNKKYERYYKYLGDCGFTLVTVPPHEAMSDVRHKWGLAPFHFTNAVYESLRDQILETLSSPSGFRSNSMDSVVSRELPRDGN